MFVTQRGLLYAIPAGLVLLCSWRARFFPDKENNGRPLPFWVEVLLYSTMPLFHLHTFIFLSLLLGCWIVMSFMLRNPAGFIPLLKLVVCSVIPATTLIALITGFQGGSVIHWVHDGDWQYGEQPQFDTWAHTLPVSQFLAPVLGHTACWIVNFGAFPFFVLLLVYVLFRRRGESASTRAGAFVFPAALIFILSYFVMFAPWDWDNTKLMVWCYLLVLPFLWDQFLKGEIFPVRGMCCLLLYFSGFISLLGGIDNKYSGYDLATRSEVDEIASAVRPLPIGTIFAGYPTYDHPLLIIGRNMVEGYDGHLVSYGIDYAEHRKKLESLLNGETEWRHLARELHVRYVFWGKREQDAYPDSALPWKDECRKVAEGSWGAVYDLDAPAAGRHVELKP